MSPAQETALAQRLGSSYYATATLDGKELRNAYVPEYRLGEGAYGANWVRIQQTDTDPERYDASLRAAPGPGYAVRNPARPMRREIFSPYQGAPPVTLFSDEAQFCGTDGLMVAVLYTDINNWREDLHIPTPIPSPTDGKWIVVLDVHRDSPGEPTCLGTPLPPLPRR